MVPIEIDSETFMGRKAGYLVNSNKEAGLGRFDIMVQQHKKVKSCSNQ